MACLISRLLMLLMLLPWGAYAGVTAAPSHVEILIESECEPVTADGLGNHQTQVTMSKSCRTATLPGFACSPDQAIPATTLAQWRAPDRYLAGPAADCAKRGRTDPPPKDPPRFS